MTKWRPTARFEAVSPALTPPPTPRRIWVRGLAALGLGAGLAWFAVSRSNGMLGFLSLTLVLGSLAWISIGLIRHWAARFRRP